DLGGRAHEPAPLAAVPSSTVPGTPAAAPSARTAASTSASRGGSPPKGSEKRNTAPPPSRVRAEICPPCSSTMLLQIVSPSPTPERWRAQGEREDLSKSFVSLSRGKPRPRIGAPPPNPAFLRRT